MLDFEYSLKVSKMKAIVVILLVMVTGALTSAIDLSKREELDPGTRLRLREGRLKRWCTDCKIQYTLITRISAVVTLGYVYEDTAGNPLPEYGVIIGISIDLSHITVHYLRNVLWLSDDLIAKLEPYLGLQGAAAAAKLASDPLELSEEEANHLSNIYVDEMVSVVEGVYNEAVENLGQMRQLFIELTCQQRTVITFLYIRYYNLPVWDQSLWNYLVRQLWEEAIGILNNFPYIEHARGIIIAELRVVGTIRCICTGWAYVCHDPHIATFDGRHFGYQGVCSYILFTNGCGQRRGTFSVESTTEASGRVNGKDVSTVSALTVRITDQSYPTIINLNRNDITLINGKRLTSFPYHVNSNTVIDKTADNETRVRVYGKFAITWDGESRIQTILDDELFGQVCGLLGDADGDKTNDFRMPNGTLTKSLDEFGRSWEVPGSHCRGPQAS